MKKRILKTGMVCVMCMMLAACGKADKNVEPTEAPTVTLAATEVPTSTPTPEPTVTSTPTPEPTATNTPTPEPTVEPMPEDTYEKGVIEGNTFESEWMGLRFNPPATVIMATQEEMDAMMMQGSQLMYGENAEEMLDYAALTTVNEMHATWLLGMPVVQIMVEKMPIIAAEITEADYLASVKANLEAVSGTNGIVYTVDENMYSMELAGQTYYSIATSVDAGNGVIIYQDYVVRKKENRMIVIAFSYMDNMEQYLQEALNAFTAY